RQQDRGQVVPPEGGRDDHAQDLPDRAAGQAVHRRGERGPVEVRGHRRHTPGEDIVPLDSPAMDEPLRDNQALWDAWTGIHVPSRLYDVGSFRDGTEPIRLSEYEREGVRPVDGRTRLHLQCHFGLDTLSWARLGARVTGLDFSAEAVAAARALAADVGIDAR